MSTPEHRALRDVPIVEPGHDFGSITDKISAVVLTQRTPRFWYVGFGIGFVLLMGLWSRPEPALPRHRHLGSDVPVGWEHGHHQLRLVDRHQPAGTLISAILLLLRRVAELDQPFAGR
jgi:molybdopterin-containing oxidoreductase family membrane subunit